jgi:hypothetical protein
MDKILNVNLADWLNAILIPLFRHRSLNPLKLAALTISNSAFCIDGFCMILRINRD